VLAETVKPEDAAALHRAGPARVVVLNKADLCGFGGAGPLARAAAHCRALQAQCGVEVLPLAALLAAADVDDDMVGALGVLAHEPADLGSTDRFTAGVHPLSLAVRERLLAELDLFGIAHAVLAVRRGADRAAVNATLHRLSGVAAVLDAIASAGYRCGIGASWTRRRCWPNSRPARRRPRRRPPGRRRGRHRQDGRGRRGGGGRRDGGGGRGHPAGGAP
jgi:uncharacterized membrane protein YgcG